MGCATVCVVFTLAASVLTSRADIASAAGPVHFANGVKIGEVSSNSALIWTRLTQRPERLVGGKAFRTRADLEQATPPPAEETYEQRALRVSAPIPAALQLDGQRIEEMDGAVPGAAGEVRLVVWEDGAESAPVLTGDWEGVGPERDYTHQFAVTNLRPGTFYHFRVEGRASREANSVACTSGSFRTAPEVDAAERVTFTVVTGQDYARRDDPVNGHKTYRLMAELRPSFFVHTGDEEYMDKPTPLATNVALARFKWNRIYALPFIRAFHRHVPSYFIKDDHDVLKDDAWPGQTYGELTFAEGLAVEREQVPTGEKPYRTFRWGRDLQIWLPEGREFRSPNDEPDGPEKTIWGAEQKAWFFRTVQASDATFRIVIAPTPIVGPDRVAKGDNHANAGFAREGAELRHFLAAQKNMLVITGDRHWQYVSVDPETGLREYSSGPTSDAHAGGWSESNRLPMHRYLRVKGGFLHVTVERLNGVPRAVLRHYGTDGVIYYEDIVSAAEK